MRHIGHYMSMPLAQRKHKNVIGHTIHKYAHIYIHTSVHNIFSFTIIALEKARKKLAFELSSRCLFLCNYFYCIASSWEVKQEEWKEEQSSYQFCVWDDDDGEKESGMSYAILLSLSSRASYSVQSSWSLLNGVCILFIIVAYICTYSAVLSCLQMPPQEMSGI